jgi:hypothetical protein
MHRDLAYTCAAERDCLKGTRRDVTTAAERPILSGPFSAIQWVKWPYLGNILDTSKEDFVLP